MSLPPGPSEPPLLQLLYWSIRPIPFMESCARRFGEVFTLDLPAVGKFVLISSPDLIRQVFTEGGEALHAGKANVILEPILGSHSVLLLDGPAHMRQRRLLLPPFHGERMQAYAAQMRSITEADMERWPRDRPFSIHDRMQAITLSVILRAVFGLEEGAAMSELAAMIVEFFEPPPAVFVFIPHLQKIDTPLSPLRRFNQRKARVRAELRSLITERRRATDLASRVDILSLLLTAKDEDGNGMTDEEVSDELMTMIAAGHETTATSLCWVFEHLLNDARAASLVEAEARRAMSAKTLDAEAVAGLTYIDAVVKETLRLRPILPIVVRRVDAPFKLGDIELPERSNVAPCIYLTHRRADLYPEPERWIPERFLGKKVDPYAWLPFGGGIRRCIGMAFALFEMKIILATVMSQARLRLEALHPATVTRRGIALAPSEGPRVVLS